MNKKILVSTIIGVLLTPVLGYAETKATSTNGTSTPAKVAVLCHQTSIDKRDATVATAKDTYNKAVASALSIRKEAEKAAVALTDRAAQKEAMKKASEAYRTLVKSAQDTLSKARKEIWSTYETEVKVCNQTRNLEKKKLVEEKKTELKDKKDNRKETKEIKKDEIEKKQIEIKTLRENLKLQLENLKSLFKRSAPAPTTGTTTTTQ